MCYSFGCINLTVWKGRCLNQSSTTFQSYIACIPTTYYGVQSKHRHLFVQDIAVKLLPGVPVKPVLVGDDPFLTGPVLEEHHALALEGGVPIPVFSVRAHDKYGNVCIPSPALTWSISTESAGISPNPALASPDTSGVATLLNAQIARNVAKDEDWTVPVCISVTPAATEAAEGMDEIIQAAADAQSKLEGLKLLLAPSTGPHSLAMCAGDNDIEFEDSPEAGKRVFNVRSLDASLGIIALHTFECMHYIYGASDDTCCAMGILSMMISEDT